MTIRFYSSPGRYAFLSNFSPHGFELDGLYWPTSEHYYQAQKFDDPALREKIRLAPAPGAAKSMGRGKLTPIRSDWDSVREEVMRRALAAKFAAHPELAAELVATGDEELIEDSRSDYYWGCGADGSGANRLGVLLMALRAELADDKAHSTKQSTEEPMSELILPGIPGTTTWLNTPAAASYAAGTLHISAGPQTDYFIDPMGGAVKSDAPVLTFAPDPQFTLAAHVAVDFTSTYDAGVLMVYADALHWGKFCFEYSPHGEPTIVSVVTNGVSDDCNSVPLTRTDIYMRVTRLGDAFAFHYSEDGKFWRLVRYFSLRQMTSLVAGFSSQSPTGAGCQASFAEIRYAPAPVSDVRSGV